jgi:hypothetical protein|eukprot:COSAG06_NODE_1550_length_9129_cov_4.644408_7_plen_41_part_00
MTVVAVAALALALTLPLSAPRLPLPENKQSLPARERSSFL